MEKKKKGQSALNFARKVVPIVQQMKICELKKKVCETFEGKTFFQNWKTT